MGANQSEQPRCVNLENENPTGIIDVSDEVVNRLKNSLLKEKQKASPVVVPVPKLPNEHQQYIPPPTISQPSTHSINSNQPTGIYYAEPINTSFDIRRQKEIELQQNDAYWRKRLSQLEQSLKRTNTIMEKEYSTAIEGVRNRFLTPPSINQSSPCQELKLSLMKCYQVNSDETLKCSDDVNAFVKCVCEERIKKLESQSVNVDPKSTTVVTIPIKSDNKNANINPNVPPKGA